MIKAAVKEGKINEKDVFNMVLQHFTYLKSLWSRSQTPKGRETIANARVRNAMMA